MPGLKSPHQPDLLPLRQAASLGYGSYNTLRRRITQGQLRAQRVNNRLFVRRADLDAIRAVQPSVSVEEAVAKAVASAPTLTSTQVDTLRAALSH